MREYELQNEIKKAKGDLIEKLKGKTAEEFLKSLNNVTFSHGDALYYAKSDLLTVLRDFISTLPKKYDGFTAYELGKSFYFKTIYLNKKNEIEDWYYLSTNSACYAQMFDLRYFLNIQEDGSLSFKRRPNGVIISTPYTNIENHGIGRDEAVNLLKKYYRQLTRTGNVKFIRIETDHPTHIFQVFRFKKGLTKAELKAVMTAQRFALEFYSSFFRNIRKRSKELKIPISESAFFYHAKAGGGSHNLFYTSSRGYFPLLTLEGFNNIIKDIPNIDQDNKCYPTKKEFTEMIKNDKPFYGVSSFYYKNGKIYCQVHKLLNGDAGFSDSNYYLKWPTVEGIVTNTINSIFTPNPAIKYSDYKKYDLHKHIRLVSTESEIYKSYDKIK